MIAPNLLDAALTYRAKGFSILPIGQDKKPNIRSWQKCQIEAANAGTIRRWFKAPGVTGLAVVCGRVSGGLVVRDYDDAQAYQEWKRTHPDLSELLPTSKTCRGFHVFFQGATDRITTTGDGELRGAGYVLLPPSLHPSGVHYTWVIPMPPDGLPVIDDPAAAGFLGARPERQRDRETEKLRDREIEAIAPKASFGELFLSTIPKTAGQRNKRLFDLARLLKAQHPNVESERLKPIVREWFSKALPNIGTQDWDVTWADFLYGFDRVRHPLGSWSWETIMQDIPAIVPNEILPPPARQYENPALRRLVVLCRKLQDENKEQPFYLAASSAAKALGLPDDEPTRKVVGRWLATLLPHDGILTITEKGGVRRATRYRWIVVEECGRAE